MLTESPQNTFGVQEIISFAGISQAMEENGEIKRQNCSCSAVHEPQHSKLSRTCFVCEDTHVTLLTGTMPTSSFSLVCNIHVHILKAHLCSTRDTDRAHSAYPAFILCVFHYAFRELVDVCPNAGNGPVPCRHV